MLDFLFDNPFLLVILLFWLFSTIFGKKKQKAGEKGTTVAETKPDRKGGTRKERYRELMEQLEGQLNAGTASTSRTIAVAEPVAVAPPPAVPAPPASDPYAFHSASGLESRPGPAPSESIDYDISATDYDTPLEGGSRRGGSYEYRPTIDEPEEQEYHLTGFREFHAAQGLTEKDRMEVKSAEPAARRASVPAIDSLFASPDELRRAFLLQEIFGKPKGLRPPGR